MADSEQLVSGGEFVSVPTRVLEASAAFYRQTLGVQQSVFRPDRGFVEFETSNLGYSLRDSPKPRSANSRKTR